MPRSRPRTSPSWHRRSIELPNGPAHRIDLRMGPLAAWYGGASFNPFAPSRRTRRISPTLMHPRKPDTVRLLDADLSTVWRRSACSRNAFSPPTRGRRLLTAGSRRGFRDDRPRAVCYIAVVAVLGAMQQSPRTVFSVNRNRAFTCAATTRVGSAPRETSLAVTKPAASRGACQGRPRRRGRFCPECWWVSSAPQRLQATERAPRRSEPA